MANEMDDMVREIIANADFDRAVEFMRVARSRMQELLNERRMEKALLEQEIKAMQEEANEDGEAINMMQAEIEALDAAAAEDDAGEIEQDGEQEVTTKPKKKAPLTMSEKIMAALGNCSSTLSIDQIMKRIKGSATREQVSRRLSDLVRRGLVERPERGVYQAV